MKTTSHLTAFLNKDMMDDATLAKAREEHRALCNVADAFDAWYCESGHLCNLLDAVKSNSVTEEQKDELLRLHNLLNASIKLSTIRKSA